MENIRKAISYSLFSLLLVASISLYRASIEVDMQNEEIEILMEEIGYVEDKVDSISALLQIERRKYDSLCNELDSSEIRYNNVVKKYAIKKEKVRYLNTDESINFLQNLLKSVDYD